MKQRLYILILAFSLSVLLGIPFVKHHHHGATVCTASEYCEHDHTQNDRHTSHHGDRTAPCAERGEYVVSRSSDSESTDMSCQSVPVIYGYIPERQLPASPTFADGSYPIYGTVTVPTSAESSIHGLRAPPRVKC
ncbi:MAG: hypothetical protein NC127_06740 [Muribaculum sp.]|nr:hypothetical protein [Muribaculum sp.]